MVFPYNLIDLTHTIDDSIPTYNGGCGFNSHIHIDYEACEGDPKFRVMKIQSNAGIGTHMDAPSHCIPGGACVHEFTPEDLCMPCTVIDISSKAHERYRMTVEDIEAFEFAHGPIQTGSCVMVKTGWEAFWGEPEKYRNNLLFPSVSIEAANLLLERGVKALGIDTLSADRPEDDFKVHKAILGNGHILLENVANLDLMPPVGAFILALPMKMKDLTEAPLRLVGLTEKKR